METLGLKLFVLSVYSVCLCNVGAEIFIARLGILKQYAVSCALFPADCWEVPGKAVSS